MSIQKILLKFEPKAENLLGALKEIQKENKYISEKECEGVARYFSLSLTKVFSAASFFDLLKTRKESKKIIKVCSGGPCLSEKSAEIVREIEKYLRIELENDGHASVKLELMSCVGLCDRGPVMSVDDQVFEKVRPEMVDDIIRNYL
ncbi:MAG TPA: NAD(P)H-dependent oxidoreductase subunit E [Candidatus Bathyarchaeia archaeon]|nr:NAD(P)H-dependent oxidoreductase subunit E [Candidatus Bathyarchaeia archaeon]